MRGIALRFGSHTAARCSGIASAVPVDNRITELIPIMSMSGKTTFPAMGTAFGRVYIYHPRNPAKPTPRQGNLSLQSPHTLRRFRSLR